MRYHFIHIRRAGIIKLSNLNYWPEFGKRRALMLMRINYCRYKMSICRKTEAEFYDPVSAHLGIYTRETFATYSCEA